MLLVIVALAYSLFSGSIHADAAARDSTEVLPPGVILEADQIDSNKVRVGASVAVVYGLGYRSPVSGEWLKLTTARGTVQAIDGQRLLLALEVDGRSQRIDLARIQTLIMGEVSVPLSPSRDTAQAQTEPVDSLTAKEIPPNSMDGTDRTVGEPGMGAGGAATGVEIGTLFGLSLFSDEGDVTTAIGVPAGIAGSFGAIGLPSLYVAWFPSEGLAIGPEFSWGRVSTDRDDLSSLYLGGRGMLFLQDNNVVSGPYVLGHCALVAIYAGAFPEREYFAGGGLGSQWRVGPAFVVRTEIRFRRWFDDQVGEFSFLLGLGTRLGSR